ncbi:MAG: hypothetical protein ACI92E_000344 [Oceanicoccus sp.]|jgi:hypothetical protein
MRYPDVLGGDRRFGFSLCRDSSEAKPNTRLPSVALIRGLKVLGSTLKCQKL